MYRQTRNGYRQMNRRQVDSVISHVLLVCPRVCMGEAGNVCNTDLAVGHVGSWMALRTAHRFSCRVCTAGILLKQTNIQTDKCIGDKYRAPLCRIDNWTDVCGWSEGSQSLTDTYTTVATLYIKSCLGSANNRKRRHQSGHQRLTRTCVDSSQQTSLPSFTRPLDDIQPATSEFRNPTHIS